MRGNFKKQYFHLFNYCFTTGTIAIPILFITIVKYTPAEIS
jgi:hypothetical protein